MRAVVLLTASMSLANLQLALAHDFRDVSLLRTALIHRSHGSPNNERLEFLGDSVVNCAIALALYKKFPELPEGDLSRLRANLVSEPALASLADSLGIGAYLALGAGEVKTGGSHRPSILADALEALLGAVMLDGGFEAACIAVERVFAVPLAAVSPTTTVKDAKTLLQEYLQHRHLPLPKYDVVAIHGASHEQEFEVMCVLEHFNLRCTGRGSSRRRAEQEAARHAYEQVLRT